METVKLSPYSKMLYNEWLLYPESTRYNMAVIQKIEGNLNIHKLKRALRRFVNEHCLFNSHVSNIGGNLCWVKNNEIFELDYSDISIDDNFLNYYINLKFDLNKGPLYRSKLLKLGSKSYIILIVMHHIIIDGASANKGFFGEISKYYNDQNYRANIPIDMQANMVNKLSGGLYLELEKSKHISEEFWYRHLQHVKDIDLTFLTNPCNKKNKDTGIEQLDFTFPIIEKLSQLKRKYLITPYLFSQCVFAVLLYRYTKIKEFAICYPVAIKEGIDIIYGSQVNTSLVVYKFEPDMTFTELITQIRNFFHSLKADHINHSYYPISDLVKIKGKGLLNAFFNQANFAQTTFRFDDVKQIDAIDNTFNNDLIDFLLFRQEATNSGLHFKVNYSKTYFDKVLLENFVTVYKKIFIEILDDLLIHNSNKLISKYTLLNAAQSYQLTYSWNNTDKKYPMSNALLNQLFESAVKVYSKEIALVYENKKITYQGLNQKANQLARCIKKSYNITVESVISLFLHRNENMIIAILAVLKLGVPYVPISPDYPPARTRYIIQETGSTLILTNEIYLEKIDSFFTLQENKPILQTLAIDSKKIVTLLKTLSSNNLNIKISNNNLAYIIYTSGSTGKPKGVMVEHKNVVNTILSILPIYDFQHGNKVLAFTSYMFDVSISEVFAALSNGGELHIISENLYRDEKLISVYLLKNWINYVYLPPAMLAVMPRIVYPGLVGIIYAGESCDKETGEFWSSSCKLYNFYGPTETAIYAAGKQVINGDVELIGRPLCNVKLYVLDDDLSVLPLGAIGELYISGRGVSRGYINNKKLTQEKFLDSPFEGNSKLYKTGDFVRLLPDKNFEYIGRNDTQVKIYGYRIELEEIKTQLIKYPGIKHAFVIVDETVGKNNNINKSIIAYYSASEKLEENSILTYLENSLPYYMIPNIIIFLYKFPTKNQSGKFDISALPRPTLLKEESYVKPTNYLELKMCEAFAKVLDLPKTKVGINNNFFKLGGNSILAISLVNQLNAEFEINIDKIYEYKTPAKIAKALLQKKDEFKIKDIRNIYKTTKYVIDDKVINKFPESIYKKYKAYIEKTSQIVAINNPTETVEKILLTGATGYLGCHVLYYLLRETQHKIFLLIRAESDESAYSRLKKKYLYYFNEDIFNYMSRIVIFSGDLKNTNLNLNNDRYDELANNIDSIIHCAALVKHYGEYSTFYYANVQSTNNLLELSKLTKKKDFHYISTIGTILDSYVVGEKYYVFNEDDDLNYLSRRSNVYATTKYEAETLVYNHRQLGMNTNIYRLGNLVMNSSTYRFQENIDDNMFFSHFKICINSGIIPKEILEVEASPVDYTSLAIVKLFQQRSLNNQTYHLFNPSMCNLYQILNTYKNVHVKKGNLGKFVDFIREKLSIINNQNQVELLMIYRLWLAWRNEKELTQIKILQDKTNKILREIGFSWPHLTAGMFSELVKKAVN